MSYTRLIYHIVFRTYRSMPTIREENESLLYKYIWGIVKNHHGVLDRIGGMPDHIHMLVELPPDIKLSEFVKSVKIATNMFARNHRQEFPHFEGWAKKYCALTYSAHEKDKIVNYIKGQKEHHRKETFAEELARLLKEQGIQYDPKYYLTD